ncbi:recombination mediator protein UvsY, partial [Arthrospira platensis SPKY1]|nr:recombination mediator protein UvsY [Arthrospira platensis SPKY1]
DIKQYKIISMAFRTVEKEKIIMSNLESIEEMWMEDAKIDRTDLAKESLSISELHQKYYKIFLRERVTLLKEQRNYNAYYKTKHEYYSGKLSSDELKEYGWKPFQLLLGRSDIQLYLDGDQDLTDRLLKLAIQKEKVEFIESILKTINNRSFQIRAAIDFIKFCQGAV